MKNIKDILHNIAEQLPEHASFDDVFNALYLHQKLAEGLNDLDEGRTFTQEEVEQSKYKKVVLTPAGKT